LRELAVVDAEGEEARGVKVGVDVAAAQAGDGAAAIDVAAGDGGADVAGVRVDREDQAGGVHAGAHVVVGPAVGALRGGPAAVRAGRGRRRQNVGSLERILADVADVEVLRAGVEAAAPRVAQAVGADRGERALPGLRGEVVRRD